MLRGRGAGRAGAGLRGPHPVPAAPHPLHGGGGGWRDPPTGGSAGAAKPGSGTPLPRGSGCSRGSGLQPPQISSRGWVLGCCRSHRGPPWGMWGLCCCQLHPFTLFCKRGGRPGGCGVPGPVVQAPCARARSWQHGSGLRLRPGGAGVTPCPGVTLGGFVGCWSRSPNARSCPGSVGSLFSLAPGAPRDAGSSPQTCPAHFS